MNPNAILSKLLPFDFYFDLLSLVQNRTYAKLDGEFDALYKITSRTISKMFTVISMSPNGQSNPEEMRRRKYLLYRGSVICLGISKFMAAILYVILYLLTHSVKPKEHIEHLLGPLQLCLLVAIGPFIVFGTLLVISSLKAMKFHQLTLLLAIIFAIVLGIYDLFLGGFGAYIYFSSIAFTRHFIMFVVFICQATNIICTAIYDVPLIRAFRSLRKQETQLV
ncbi:uncharacterized protein LOC105398294 [Plutella xylostella]|uniref:uncharacterized protein LOC105398294 n=1 Tax=Plutella xylostella TaxID=51655 RepID=UPI00203268CB|nr:uncharacterized protein LOC105398294 [Plutella xylostella]